MEIYLDANATTRVLPQAIAAAQSAMAEVFGNPSSSHASGLKARAMLDKVRAAAYRALGIASGQLLFTSGATEGIQTAVLSALSELRKRRDTGSQDQPLLLYGATEHQAVPQALRHWNAVLGLNFDVLPIPVRSDGQHDLEWLREHVPRAGMVCTMAANNETGVISDLDGIASILKDSRALWLVDSVQALGKLDLKLAERRINYAPFSGHKLYAPKGIGLLYVREGTPFMPLLAGGGQESAMRSGTENMVGIAALGAVLSALNEGDTFHRHEALEKHRELLEAALREAFPGVIFNAPSNLCLPTTLNFSVPGLSSKVLLDLFDAASLRVSGGSACSAAKAKPSYVLEAMGLPSWQTAAAVRLSFGPADSADLIMDACARIRACGVSLQASCLSSTPQIDALPAELITRFVVDGACCYLVADAATRRCVVIDPVPELTEQIAQWLRCRGFTLSAVLDTHSHGDHVSSAAALREAAREQLQESGLVSKLGWPHGVQRIELGDHYLTQLDTPGHTVDSVAYLLHNKTGLHMAFVGDTVMPGALGRSDFEQSEHLGYAGSLLKLERTVGPHTLLLPGHDYEGRFASNLSVECAAQPLLAGVLRGQLDAVAFAVAKAKLEQHIAPTAHKTLACGTQVDCDSAEVNVGLSASKLTEFFSATPEPILVDVREPYEQRLASDLALVPGVSCERAPLSTLINSLHDWLRLPAEVPLLFFCRSGNRSAQVARALRRLGHTQAWSLEGGLALWPQANSSKPPTSVAMVTRV